MDGHGEARPEQARKAADPATRTPVPMRIGAVQWGLNSRPSREEAEEAVALLIRWAGDDPDRPGLGDTPARVARAFEEWFRGYGHDPAAHLARRFSETDGYTAPVTLRDIPFHSHCEHHMAPIRGKAHVAYLPDGCVVGISKLARVVEVLSRRLQIQERLTTQIAHAIEEALKPRGVAVVLEAEHACMTSRGVNATGTWMTTHHMSGAFDRDAGLRREFLASIAG